MATWDGYKKVLKYTSPLSWLVVEGTEKAARAVAAAADRGQADLEIEVAKQTMQLQFAQLQAKIEQELAIARRIDNAVEVEIEEFYDTSGKASIGASVDPAMQTGSFNFGAEGRRVTKRVYHFRGIRTDAQLPADSDQTSG